MLGVATHRRVGKTARKHDDAIYATIDELTHTAFFIGFIPIAAHEQRGISIVQEAMFYAAQALSIERTIDGLT